MFKENGGILFWRKQKNKVVLRNEQRKNDSRFLSAELKENGDLVFVSQDMGPAVVEFYGVFEYEYIWTIKAEHVSLVQEVLGDKQNVLKVLKKHFENNKTIPLHKFLHSNNIPFEQWSRVGD